MELRAQLDQSQCELSMLKQAKAATEGTLSTSNSTLLMARTENSRLQDQLSEMRQ